MLENVAIEDSGSQAGGWPTLFADNEARIDHAILRSTTNERAGCSGYDLAIVDSVCAGRDGFYVSTFGGPLTIDLRNSVLYGTEFGALVAGNGELDLKVNSVNTVIRAETGGEDIHSEPFEAKGVVHLDLEHSNFASIEKGGPGETVLTGSGNQSATPAFVNAAGGDFREAAGSPTIDAGLDDPLNGLTDLAGNPRDIGAHTDIGAYEFLIAPAAETGVANGVTQTAATVTGTVNPNGLAGSAQFRYGTSTAYGSAASVPAPGAGTSPVAVSAVLTGLAPGTTYHYELVATTAEGTSVGADRTFTTASATTGGGTPASKPVLSRLRISPSSLRTPGRGRKHTGATVTFTLSETAGVSFAIEARRPGRRGKGGRCVAPTSSNRHARSCRRTVTLGRFSRSGRSGTNRFHFSGVLGHGALRPSGYVLAATPKSGALAGATRSVGFRVLG